MKVLFICNKGEIGGATNSLLTLIEHLKEMNIEPIVITPSKDGKVMNFCKKAEIQCHYIKFYEIGYSLNTSFLRRTIKILLLPLFFFGNRVINHFAVKKIINIINMSEIDYIHTNVNRDDLGILLSKKTGIKNIMHLREYGTLDFECIYLRKNIYAFMNKKVDKFIAISHSIKEFYVGSGIEENKIITIYNGIDYRKITPKTSTKVEHKPLKIIILSGISEAKGQVQVIEAINRLPKNIKKNIELHLYGSGSKEYISFLQKKITEYKLDKNVSFMGYRANIYSIINEYDLAITPSKSEAFGRVTVEYMFAKLPVIASNTGANIEIIANEETGLIYEYNNIDDLKNKILYLYNNPTIRRNLGEQGYLDAKNRFDSIINAINIKKIYTDNDY